MYRCILLPRPLEVKFIYSDFDVYLLKLYSFCHSIQKVINLNQKMDLQIEL